MRDGQPQRTTASRTQTGTHATTTSKTYLQRAKLREFPMLKRAVLTWGATLVILALTVSSAWSAPAAQTTPSATPTPVAVDTFNPADAGGRTVVKWYVGLGTGGDPKQIDIQRQVV